MAKTEQSVPPRVGQIASAIIVLRGQRVILDVELAALYGVTTKRLNEQVKRNASRFPQDFCFRLKPTEVDGLNRSQIATGSQKYRDPPSLTRRKRLALDSAGVLTRIEQEVRALGRNANDR